MFEYKLDAACLRFYLLTGMGLPAGLLQAFAETIFAQSTTATSAGKNNGPDVCDVWKKCLHRLDKVGRTQLVTWQFYLVL